MKTITALIIALLLLPATSRAICLKDCTSTAQRTESDRFDSGDYREKSHNTGNVRNSVMGDMNVNVGHKRLNLNIGSGSNNTVDASINSTIILGDMKK